MQGQSCSPVESLTLSGGPWIWWSPMGWAWESDAGSGKIRGTWSVAESPACPRGCEESQGFKGTGQDTLRSGCHLTLPMYMPMPAASASNIPISLGHRPSPSLSPCRVGTADPGPIQLVLLPGAALGTVESHVSMMSPKCSRLWGASLGRNNFCDGKSENANVQKSKIKTPANQCFNVVEPSKIFLCIHIKTHLEYLPFHNFSIYFIINIFPCQSTNVCHNFSVVTLDSIVMSCLHLIFTFYP